ncbi:MAG: hypothetical protein ACRC8Q_02670, partial [Aeromonas sp.]
QQGEPVYLHSLSKSWKLTLLQQGGTSTAQAWANAPISPCCNKVLKVDSVNRAIQWLKSTRTDSKRAQS